MRNNQPVTNREVEVLDDHAIVSKTDLDGNITYVNPYFTEISGFSEQELMGAPQNIVRHPDMPAEAFADLWASIKSGTPWTGMVKNRCKNGDFYWVRANVTPIREGPHHRLHVGAHPPERHQVAKAEQVYRTMRTESNHGIRIKNGQVIQPGVGTLLSRLSHVSLAMRIWLATSVVNVLQVIVCGAVLLDGNSATTTASLPPPSSAC
jgi:aerotaxis receptor